MNPVVTPSIPTILKKGPTSQSPIPNSIFSPAKATYEVIPTSTWGPFTIVVVIFLVIVTCLILNCSRIRRKVDERKMDRLGRSGPLSFEKRHKDLQEADLEWNNHPPMVFTNEKLSTPESTYSSGSKHSFLSCSDWSSAHSTVAQKHHYQDKNFIKNQPPSIQLRLTLENASVSSLVASVEPARTKPIIHSHPSQPHSLASSYSVSTSKTTSSTFSHQNDLFQNISLDSNHSPTTP